MVVAAGIGAAYQAVRLAGDREEYPPPGRIVQVGGGEALHEAPRRLDLQDIAPGKQPLPVVGDEPPAAARPQLGRTGEQSLTEGIDIQVVLDVSGSMAAKDFQPRNRLQVAKEVIEEFIARRSGDRIGIVVFAGQALTRAPLTGDHRMLRQLVDAIELYAIPDGTAIGLALAAAAARLKDSAAETRVAVLLTDGVNNAGSVDPVRAAELAAAAELVVHDIPGRGRCPDCGREVAVTTFMAVCGECGGALVEVLQGVFSDG